jgi:MFS family permease
LGQTLIGSLYVNNLGLLAIVVAGGPLPLVLALVAIEQATDGGRTIYEINVVTLLQNRVPEGMAGRVFATYETVRSTGMLLGLLAGGILGQVLGLRTVLALALAANLLVPLCLVFSPLRHLRTLQPDPSTERLAM